MTTQELKRGIDARIKRGRGIEILENDCEIIEFLLDNCDISISEENTFFVKVNCAEMRVYTIDTRLQILKNIKEADKYIDGSDALAFTGGIDFGHTSAEWESVIALGISGLLRRIEEKRLTADDEEKLRFYDGLIRVYSAAIRFIRRASELARECGKTEMGQGLENLCSAAPKNLFEAMQVSTIYYTLQQFFDGTILRTLGRLDKLFYPYYVKEDAEYRDELILKYLNEIGSWEADANIPFALCGTDKDDNDLTNELSYKILDIYTALKPHNVKMHILCSQKTPNDIIEKAFRSIRDGSNSIVFVCDETVIRSLEEQGAEHNDAVNYHVVGCYECGAEGELPSTCNARVNIPKALELALNGGRDMLTGRLIGLENSGEFASYEELWAEFERQLRYLCSSAMALTDIYEAEYPRLHSAPFLSGTYTSALEKGADLYTHYSAKYNSSSINCIGVATATDSLAAIRKAVYEDKLFTLDELRDVLRSDWEGREYERLLIRNRYPKFGNGDKRTDDVAKRIVDAIVDQVRGKPNAKGGSWRVGLFSIDWRWAFGEKTAASADGRRSGETLSQNTSATFFADREGATAHLISVARIDGTRTPNGTIADIDLHSSAVKGENGINALVTSLRTHFALGGFAAHYNVLDTEVLKEAKLHPERYPNLQVRLCGWNVRFNSLSEKEKDDFIARSMK